MGRVAAFILTLILAMSYTSMGVNAQNEEKIEIFSNSINTTGPVWLEYNCEQTACQGMELIVNNLTFKIINGTRAERLKKAINYINKII